MFFRQQVAVSRTKAIKFINEEGKIFYLKFANKFGKIKSVYSKRPQTLGFPSSSELVYQKLSYSEHFEEIGISFYYQTALGKVQIMQKTEQKFPVICTIMRTVGYFVL